MRNPRQVLTRSVIFDRVWGYDFGYGSNSLDVYISYLRKKTEAGGKPRLIHTVRGVGYALARRVAMSLRRAWCSARPPPSRSRSCSPRCSSTSSCAASCAARSIATCKARRPRSRVSPRFFDYLVYEPNVYEIDISPARSSAATSSSSAANGDVYVPSEYVTPTPRIPVTSRSRAVAAGKGRGFYYDTGLQGEDTRVFTMPTQPMLPRRSRSRSSGSSPASTTSSRGSGSGSSSSRSAGSRSPRAPGCSSRARRCDRVRDLSETAERVRATRDLSQRIEVEGSDELEHSSRATFNEMLAVARRGGRSAQRQLVQDASHELRTPLTSLRTNIEVLAADEHMPPERAGAAPPRRRRAARRDDRADRRADRARPRRGAGRRSSRRSGSTSLDRGRDPAHGAQPPGVPIEADARADAASSAQPASLERAIANLLDNAAKWSPAGSPVEVAARGRRADRARPRPRDRRAGRPPRLRALLPRDLGARHARVGPRARDRPPGRRGARRHDRRPSPPQAAAR